MEEGKIPRQYRHGIRHSSSHDRSSSFRSKRGSESRRERRSRSRSRSHGRRSHWRRDHSREHRHVRHHRRHRSRSHEEARRRRRRDERRRRRSSSSSSSSSCQRSRHSSKREKERETGFSRKIIGSRSELAKAQEAVKPVDPIAAKIEAANKASAIMASAIRPGMTCHCFSVCAALILTLLDYKCNKSYIFLVNAGTTGGSTYNTTATPQEVLARLQETQMAQVRAKAEAAASAANLPRFYNPMSVNAAKLAEQQQKRKLLWSKKADPETEAKEEAKSKMWKTTSMVAGKGDSAAAAKFRKLMGIHDTTAGKTDGRTSDEALNRAQAQADLFRKLEQEYEMSRTLTHTQRGVGLGYSSAVTDYSAYTAMKQAGGSTSQDGS
ncbi:unnamed protein product [Mesocestoides corti]|uniref:Small acidic protein-like domain-containing protein n=1 Tax=Mesocestoides corti TaxID=53468 RepID=A0A0R3U9U0_MESCO|nr:unnamed protein product [Mesocestoides corti]